ncbi:MAG: tetratricopeptide repeat protein [Gammaproteobacteria bacterium]|nr:tetratricopeptide repeat protein [Gammaproteobacteria bacterium]
MSIDSFKTHECLDETTIGFYVECALSPIDRDKVEAHLHSCLYCLKQINDMTEMLHYQKQYAQPSAVLFAVIKHLLNSKEPEYPFLERLKKFFTFNQQQWRFSTISLAAAWVVFIIGNLIFHHEGIQAVVPRLNPDALVKISALDNSGKVMHDQQGVIVSSDGYIEGRLQPMVGATTIEVTLRDGRTKVIQQIWKNEDTNIAVMKIDGNDLPDIPVADIESVKIGQKIFAVPNSGDKGGYIQAVVSDFKQSPGRRNSTVQYIQVASQTTTSNTGKLIDEKGNLLGFMITEEMNINLAAPADSYRQIVKTNTPTPVSELTQINFSSQALNFYMKGILARDSQLVDEAMKDFQEAIKLNPRLTGARLELGYLYYKRQQFDDEAIEYQEILKINPDDTDALYNLAWNMESHGKYEEAIVMYEKALSLTPDDTETLYQLGLSCLAQNKKDKALELYGRLKILDPGNAELLRRLIK